MVVTEGEVEVVDVDVDGELLGVAPLLGNL